MRAAARPTATVMTTYLAFLSPLLASLVAPSCVATAASGVFSCRPLHKGSESAGVVGSRRQRGMPHLRGTRARRPICAAAHRNDRWQRGVRVCVCGERSILMLHHHHSLTCSKPVGVTFAAWQQLVPANTNTVAARHGSLVGVVWRRGAGPINCSVGRERGSRLWADAALGSRGTNSPTAPHRLWCCCGRCTTGATTTAATITANTIVGATTTAASLRSAAG